MMSEKKILLYVPWAFDMLGGVDVVVDRLWKGLELRFPGMTTIGVQDWYRAGEDSDEEGRRFLYLNLPAPEKDRLTARYVMTLIRRLFGLARLLHKHRINIVNIHYPLLNVYPLALMKRLGIWKGRIILSFHGSDVAEVDPESPLWRLIADQADAITACSNALAIRVQRLSIFNQTVEVVYNGIDCAHFLQTSTDVQIPLSVPYILNVGNYIPRKAQDVLIQAFAHLTRTHTDLNLVCVGGTDNGIWLAYLHQLVVQLGIQHRVTFLENQPQRYVAALMHRALCLVHAAYNEPFGLILIEAGACGVPVIATHVGGIPEIITSPEYGCLVPPNDPEQLAEAIQSVLAMPERRDSMAKMLHQRVLSAFSAEAMVERYKAVYITAILR